MLKVGQQKESDSQLIKRLIKEKHPDVWLIEFASIGEKLNAGEYGAFTKEGLITYMLSKEKKLIKTGEISWPTEKIGEVDHFAIKSIFSIDGIKFVTGNHGKEVQKFLEGEKKDIFTKIPRAFYQKIFGFRSGKLWKQVTAVIGYLLIIIFLIGIFTGNDSETEVNHTNKEKAVETNSEVKNQNEVAKKESKSSEQDKQEVEKVASEPKNKEASEKIAAERKAKQEAEKKQKEKAANLGLVAATVARVVDGDTFELTDGRKVRLIGVNTPESTTRTEEYGKEASNYTSSKLTGKQVWLQKDVSETDRYGRLLRIVWLQIPNDDMNESEIRSKMFNANLVLNGYAEPSTYPPDVKYADYFRKFAREAREKEVGLWAYGENGTTRGDLDPKSSSQSSNNSSSNTSSSSRSSSNSSNNSNSSSGSSATSSSGGTEYFKNCTELRKKYPEGVPSDHPAYAPKHDRDKDGWACER
ncbi:thermonuclease [Aeribacillus phage AP45]|uniref:Thermonuclease n=1 Tax=Aeribacillus phage AP45 TaxID=1913112 RepID=A0A1L2JY19_9CAUD|nr:nuclease [Aeribacillus phage AP45]APC46453.1 thermonuclease [Aeribacillus phage AP45]